MNNEHNCIHTEFLLELPLESLVSHSDRAEGQTQAVYFVYPKTSAWPCFAWFSRLKYVPDLSISNSTIVKSESCIDQQNIDPSTEDSTFWYHGLSSLTLFPPKDKGMGKKGLGRAWAKGRRKSCPMRLNEESLEHMTHAHYLTTNKY